LTVKTVLNNRALANAIAAAERFGGGYMYPGAAVSYSAWRPMAPLLQTRVHFVEEWDRSPDQPRAAWNKRILASLPIGSEVTMTADLPEGAFGWKYTKVGVCKWALAHWWSEDYERVYWTPEGGFVYEEI
jgi:hypothetical protein